LFFGSRPPAILRRVVAIVVDAIDRHSGRRLAHVGIEIFKREPSFANGDAAAAVMGIVVVAWVKTARL
jgi:hypothetical protein